ncbi:putative TIM-barrel fold metal-dependent hydrolase [Constrictibacter sp. MBR-5]|jgi:predicted TIM-barrel fold metal-dependent hydrolase|uniref:amidohydrolase family protein n=1 Tax=Constrictibacter sp. MBR-5 TaxID=3156467 RepID=UPI00339735A0
MATIDMERKPVAAKDPLAGQIVDCDVHPVVKGGLKTVFPYMPAAWRHRIETKGASVGMSALSPRTAVPHGGTAVRADSEPPEGGPGGSSRSWMLKQLIEPHGIDIAVLNCLQPGALAVALAGPDESAILCSAFNDYFLEEWQLADGSGPLRYAMVVPTQMPELAAQEIDRLADQKGIAAIFMPLLNIPMGNRHYHPIYEAAQRHNLPILLHVTGTENVYHGAPVVAGGWPESFIERYVSLSQVGEANLVSLVFSGVLERFPGLRVLFVEYGFSWAVPLLWRMDKAWRGVRFDTPWVKRSPIDYVRERVRFATQPLDEPQDPKDLYRMIEMLGDEHLLFATDYPHWDNDMPMQSLRGLSPEARRRVFVDNGRNFLRL